MKRKIISKTILSIIIFLTCFFCSSGINPALHAQDNIKIKENVIFFIDFSPTYEKEKNAQNKEVFKPPEARIERVFFLEESLGGLPEKINKLTLFFFPPFRSGSAEKILENLKKATIEDQAGGNLEFNVTPENNYRVVLTIFLPQETKQVLLKYSPSSEFQVRGFLSNLFITKNVKAEPPFELESSAEVVTTPYAWENPLMFSSVPPDSVDEYQEEKALDGKRYSFSAETIKNAPQYLWLQFGRDQTFKYEISLRVPRSEVSFKYPFDRLYRKAVLLTLPTSTQGESLINVETTSHKPIFFNSDKKGNDSFTFFVPANKEQVVRIEGYIHLWPVSFTSYDGKLKEKYYASKLDQLPKDGTWLHDTYTIPGDLIESDHPEIMMIANQLMQDRTSIGEIIDATYDFVIDRIDYNYLKLSSIEEGLFKPQSALETLQKGSGICGDYSRLIIAILRAEGIPARIVGGVVDVSGQKSEPGFHAWAEVYVPEIGYWIPIDPTWGESGRKYISADLEHIPLSYELQDGGIDLFTYQGFEENRYQKGDYSIKLTPVRENFSSQKYPMPEKMAKGRIYEQNYEKWSLQGGTYNLLSNSEFIYFLEKYWFYVIIGTGIFIAIAGVLTFFILKLTAKIAKKIKARSNLSTLLSYLLLPVVIFIYPSLLSLSMGIILGIIGFVKVIKSKRGSKIVSVVPVITHTFLILFHFLASFS